MPLHLPEPSVVREPSATIVSAAGAIVAPVATGLVVYNADERLAKELGFGAARRQRFRRRWRRQLGDSWRARSATTRSVGPTGQKHA